MSTSIFCLILMPIFKFFTYSCNFTCFFIINFINELFIFLIKRSINQIWIGMINQMSTLIIISIIHPIIMLFTNPCHPTSTTITRINHIIELIFFLYQSIFEPVRIHLEYTWTTPIIVFIFELIFRIFPCFSFTPSLLIFFI